MIFVVKKQQRSHEIIVSILKVDKIQEEAYFKLLSTWVVFYKRAFYLVEYKYLGIMEGKVQI